ncbi:MAG: hypothetical protein AAGI30_05445 [Planctomycetota bacterium]
MSTNGDSGSLEARVDAIERQLARQFRGQLQLHELQLVDEDGRLVGRLAADDEGPTMQLFDNHGALRAKVSVEGDLPAISLLDEKGQVRAWLGFAKDALRIGFADESGNSRAFIGVMKDSGPVAKFYDEKQNVVWAVPNTNER